MYITTLSTLLIIRRIQNNYSKCIYEIEAQSGWFQTK